MDDIAPPRNYDLPFRGLPTECRLIIWRFVLDEPAEVALVCEVPPPTHALLTDRATRIGLKLQSDTDNYGACPFLKLKPSRILLITSGAR